MPRSAESGQGADTAAALYERSGAAAYDVSAEQFAAILDEILRKYLFQNAAQNSAQTSAQNPAANSSHVSAEQKTAFGATLRLEELALARACAAGNERAWQDFIGRYRNKLRAMALHITRDVAHASHLADSL